MRSTILALSVLAACGGGTASFSPTTAEGLTRTGDPAAVYEIRNQDGSRAAQMIVWSQGAYLSQDGATVVHLSAELQNVGQAPGYLDASALSLQLFGGRGAELAPGQLFSIQPPGAERQPVAPGASQAYDLYFTAPPGAGLANIGALRLRWAVAHEDGRRYTQFTDFSRDPQRTYGSVHAWVPIYGYYDPFWYPPHHHHVVIRDVQRVPVRRVVIPSRPSRTRVR